MYDARIWNRFDALPHLTCLLMVSIFLAGCAEQPESIIPKTMTDFGIRANNLFFYYDDLEQATAFYTETLGLELVADYGMASILRVASDAYLTLVDAEEGMHSTDEPKSVAIALVTNQLDEWYAYLVEQGIEMKYDYEPKEGSAHDGFVALDPEGYYLEFERFNEHPENERFIPILAQNETVYPQASSQHTVPDGLGFNTMITWLYYKDLESMQAFFEDVLGLEMIVDQGWTKIYQVSSTGFIGLVDETRGMHRFAEQKAVTLSFILDDLDGWYDYAAGYSLFSMRSEKVEEGPEGKYRAFVGYDPEGYYLEFDTFYPHADNTTLMAYLNEK